MANKAAVFSVSNLLSLATREQCMKNLNKVRVPGGWKPATENVSRAAVLIPIVTIEDSASLLYTIRSPNLRTHSGQIAFPGGKIDSGETPIEAALRETEEEIGLPANKIDIWGHGPPIPGRDRKVVITPVIGSIEEFNPQDLRANIKEVAEIFAISLQTLCDPNNQYYTQFKNGYVLPVFVADEYKIWGITGYLTHIFLNSLLPDVYKGDWTKKIVIKDNEAVHLEVV